MCDEFMDVVHVTGPCGERAVVTRREIEEADGEELWELVARVIADAQAKARG
jgi:hypothetical protein